MDVQAERALVAACARGERAAWADLFARYDAVVRRELRRALGPALAAEADDLQQEAWARLYARRAALRKLRLERGGALGCWLRHLARSVAIDHARARGVRPSPSALLEEAAELPTQEPSAEQRLQLAQQRARLAEALEALPADTGERRVLRAHFHHGLSPAEIARGGAGLTAKGVETRLRRLVQRLRRSLGPCEPP